MKIISGRVWWQLVLLVGLLASPKVQAQVGIGILQVDSSAVLQLESTTRGLLLPRLTSAQRNAIANPKPGLTVFDTQDSIIYYWNAECWLPAYLEDCDGCTFDFWLSDSAVTIDRVLQDSAEIFLNVDQIFGTAQNIGFTLQGNLPVGITTNIDTPVVFNSGQNRLVIKVSAFAAGGSFPLVVQAFCGTTIKSIVIVVNVVPCYELDFFNNASNVSIAALVYATYPAAPTNQPFCVIANVFPGVEINSTNATTAAMRTGSGSGVGPADLPTGSWFGLINEGQIIGRGGDGGSAYNIASGNPDGDGFAGADALVITCKTDLLSVNGKLYGGGGGGASAAVGFFSSINLGFGLSISLCGSIGSGGGGGAGVSNGGNFAGVSCTININSLIGGAYVPGTGGSGGVFGTPGFGGDLVINQTVPILPPINLNLTASTTGGDGGEYGYPGDPSNANIGLGVSASINIPFIGNITLGPFWIIQGNPFTSFGVPFPIPGAGGYAVRRNANPFTPLPDNFYTTNNVKGQVGN